MEDHVTAGRFEAPQGDFDIWRDDRGQAWHMDPSHMPPMYPFPPPSGPYAQAPGWMPPSPWGAAPLMAPPMPGFLPHQVPYPRPFFPSVRPPGVFAPGPAGFRPYQQVQRAIPPEPMPPGPLVQRPLVPEWSSIQPRPVIVLDDGETLEIPSAMGAGVSGRVKRFMDEAHADREVMFKYRKLASIASTDATTQAHLSQLQYATAKMGEIERSSIVMERRYSDLPEVTKDAAAVRRSAVEGAMALSICMHAIARGRSSGLILSRGRPLRRSPRNSMTSVSCRGHLEPSRTSSRSARLTWRLSAPEPTRFSKHRVRPRLPVRWERVTSAGCRDTSPTHVRYAQPSLAP